MDKLREFLGRTDRWAWVGLAAVAGAALAWMGLHWARGAPIEQSVEEKWNVALRELGVEPVYPPEEDIEVGDVFAIVSSDSIPENGIVNSPLANHAIRLWRIDLSKAVDSNYSNIYVFSKKKDPPSDNPPAPESVFTLADHASDLPIVTFPKFRLTDSRAAKFGFVGNFLSAFTGSAGANSDVETEVSISRTETYGVPYLVAENALVNFCEQVFPAACEDQAVRKVLSTRIGAQIFDIVEDKTSHARQYRMGVEVGLINRVFLTREIQTRLVHAESVSGQAKLGSGDAPSASGKPADGAGAATDAAENATPATGAAETGSASESSGLAVSFDGKVLVRPVVFGFESARYHPPIPEANPNELQSAASKK
jgi:hypothetical protein